MELNNVKPGLKVKTNNDLRSTDGMLINQKYLIQRKANQEAVIHSYVGGHGGDVWWLLHESSDGNQSEQELVAPYCFDEFEPI